MTPDRLSAEHHAVARTLVARGYRVIIGYRKGGFWVRHADMSRPPFADATCFVSFARGKLCENDNNLFHHLRSADHGRLD